MATIKDMAVDVLRAASDPLSLDEILTRIVEREEPRATPVRKQAVRAALSNHPLAGWAARDRYVYLPRAFVGTSFRTPLLGADPERRRLPVGLEIAAALRPAWTAGVPVARVTLQLAAGPRLAVALPRLLGPDTRLPLPAEFWDWLGPVQERGDDWLVLRCLDAEAALYSLEGAQSAELDPSAVAAGNAQLAAAARELVSRARSKLSVTDLVSGLVAHGIYHLEPQPDPLAWVLFEQDGRFHLDYFGVTFREALTPGLRRLLADRLTDDQTAVGSLRGLTPELEAELADLEDLKEPEEPEESEAEGEEVPRLAAAQLYRLKVTLQWMPSVWRVIEILDDQTLEHLHLAIQDAFGWDNDHLYAFFLSGRVWDALLSFEAPYDGAEPPTTNQVLLRELELRPKQRFLYLFDFGDELRHDVELLEALPAALASSAGDYPRIAQTHGEAPPQYPVWDE